MCGQHTVKIMSEWVPQNESSSVTSASRSRTSYLGPIVPLVIEVIEQYVHANPNGEEFTLAVLGSIGRERLKSLAKDRSFDRVKQDVGLLVAQTLVDLYGATQVQTLRRADRKGTSARRNTWTQLPWVNSYAPHRVLATASSSERILLDTSVVRKVVHRDADALDIEKLRALKGQHAVSIADGALAELADQLIRGSISPEDWTMGIEELDTILDPDFPVAPGGKELAAMWGARPPVGLDLGEVRAYYRAAWRYLRLAKQPTDLSRSEVYHAPSGRAYAIRLDGAHVKNVLANAGGQWASWVSGIAKLIKKIKSDGDPVTEAELRKLLLSNLRLDMGVADAMRLDLVIHLLAKRAIQASTGKTPYKPKGTHNDPLDLDLLFGIPLPAWVVTSDLRLHRLVRATTSRDKSAVMTPDELLSRLRGPESASGQ